MRRRSQRKTKKQKARTHHVAVFALTVRKKKKRKGNKIKAKLLF